MKVVVFKKNKSLISKLISLITKSDYTHAAIMMNEYILIDSSETHGKVDAKSFLEYDQRDCVVYDLHRLKNIDEYLISAIGVPYDWKGVFGWLFQGNNKNKFYCFEFVLKAIRMARKDEIVQTEFLSGDTVISVLKSYDAEKIYEGKLINFRE